MDEEVRSLERVVLESPDPADRERLERAWILSGRGWLGESLPSNGAGSMSVDDERMVWRWRTPAGVSIPMVHVPGGEVRCRTCSGTGWNERHGFSGPERDPCDDCHDPRPGWRRIRPFYVGRFPVTWDEYRAFCFATDSERLPTFPWDDLRPEHGRHPVVRVSYRDVRDFCFWSGTRLPTRDEWEFAAFGPPVPHASGHVYEDEHAYEDDFPRILSKLYCLRCGDSGAGLHERPCLVAKRFPWVEPDVAEDGAMDLGPQIEEVCGRRSATGTTTPVVDESGRPTRPKGASWCGVYDMAGHVWQWTLDGDAVGGDPDPEDARSLLELPSTGRRDDTGFRVVVSALAD